MPRLSNKKLDELGDRLRRSDPTAEDLELLGQVRSLHAGPLAEVAQVLTDLGLEPGVRLKTTSTLIDKLRRISNVRLSRIQDVAGARVVVDMTRTEQDRLVERIAARFDKYRIKDRRTEPSYGYRAVHVIVTVRGRPVEIQVRTRLQHLWAQIVERLADDWGRGIRYGEPPAEPGLLVDEGVTRQELLQRVMALAEAVAVVEAGSMLVTLLSDHLSKEIGTLGEERSHPIGAGLTEASTRLGTVERRVRELLSQLRDLTTPR